MEDDQLKTRTARSIKWNAIDRVASQVLYGVTGFVLASLLSSEEFGLVGVVMIFQAFATLFVDSGFSYALIQKKHPTQEDYSSVLWFNLGVSTLLYVILFFCAPLIADFFGDERLIGLSRVMFLSFVLNGSAIVQTNMLMKRMEVKMIAVSNSLGLVVAGAVGIGLALAGYGAWALVWQTVTLGAVKSLVLWTTQHWVPQLSFSWSTIRSFFAISSRMMASSFLNVLFQYVYNFFIGKRGISLLGYYSQSDKWSKMGVSSITQVLASSFLPTLSAVQDDDERYRRACSKINRFTSYLVYPFIGGLIVLAAPIFHTLWGSKWDPSIVLFQLLLVRGVFTVWVNLFNNYLLSRGHAKAIMRLEILRDGVAIAVLLATLSYIGVPKGDNIVWGIEIMLWGQIAAAFVTFVVSLVYTMRLVDMSCGGFMRDNAPYLGLTALIIPIMIAAGSAMPSPPLKLAVEAVVGLGLYLGANHVAGSVIQREVLGFIRKKK